LSAQNATIIGPAKSPAAHPEGKKQGFASVSGMNKNQPNTIQAQRLEQ
jgi:hypothetical protein